MTKNEFLSILYERLSGLPQNDIQKSLEYYSEIIDDQIEDGVDEHTAVDSMGSIDEIVVNILSDISLPKLVKGRVKNKKPLNGWQILLLLLSLPLLIPILITFISIIFSIFIVVLSIILVLYIIMISVGISAIAGLFGLVHYLINGNIINGLMCLGVCFLCVGVTILFFYFSNFVTKGVIYLFKKIIFSIKSCFIEKRGN